MRSGHKQREHSVIYLLERTLRQLRHALHEHFREHKVKLSVDQWILLNEIRKKGVVGQAELARLTAKDPASVTRILSVLQKRKFVSRTVQEKDRRVMLVKLTAAGAKTMVSAEKAVEKYRQNTTKNVDVLSLNSVKQILDQLYFNSGGH